MHQQMLSEMDHVKHGSNKELADEMHNLLGHGKKLINDKASVLLSMKDELRRTSEHFNKITELQLIGQREAEIAHKEKLYLI